MAMSSELMPSTSLDTSRPSAPRAPALGRTTHRLSLPFDQRLLLTTALSLLTGFTLGSSHAGHLASLRFRAENAHRLPQTQPGWYLYHKSKNYYKWRVGITSGMRSGLHLAGWTALFFVVEESLDVFRGTWAAGRSVQEMEGVDELDIRKIEKGVEGARDAWSSVGAGVVTAGVWSAWHGFGGNVAARTIRMGFVVGAVYGIGQDGIAWARRRWMADEGGTKWWQKDARGRMGSRGENNKPAE